MSLIVKCNRLIIDICLIILIYTFLLSIYIIWIWWNIIYNSMFFFSFSFFLFLFFCLFVCLFVFFLLVTCYYVHICKTTTTTKWNKTKQKLKVRKRTIVNSFVQFWALSTFPDCISYFILSCYTCYNKLNSNILFFIIYLYLILSINILCFFFNSRSRR